MATGSKGEKECSMPKPTIEGPGGKKSGGKSYDDSAGMKGMRQTYKQTGKPGKGDK
ncbi:hypothetical protein [Gorillibacterium sp. CAU 1737]|uniref:hypothetical protein n=1 Tax=Gorillibacterium sp. CAU 1737 TaxID=3140362 RepID=UPI003261A006